jgi:hypothetical protein
VLLEMRPLAGGHSLPLNVVNPHLDTSSRAASAGVAKSGTFRKWKGKLQKGEGGNTLEGPNVQGSKLTC